MIYSYQPDNLPKVEIIYQKLFENRREFPGAQEHDHRQEYGFRLEGSTSSYGNISASVLSLKDYLK